MSAQFHPQDTHLTQPEPPPGPRQLSAKRAAIVVLGAVALGFALGLFAAFQFGWTQDEEGSLFDDAKVSRIFEEVSPAVVEIEAVRRLGNLQIDIPFWGSGFLVDSDGHIVTNYHVVSGGEEFIVRLSDGSEIPAERLGISQADDLAVLKVDTAHIEGLTPLTLADSSKVAPGQLAIAVGSPFREFNSIGVGVVSGIDRGHRSILQRPIPDMIQTDVPLNPGNSGGPLLNSEGEVIGINTSIRVESGSTRVEEFRVGFAVPSNTARSLLPQLIDSVDLRRPWIGIQGAPVSRQMMESRGLPRGIYVTGVFADSPARGAGLKAFPRFGSSGDGDVITAVDRVQVESVDDMVKYLNSKTPGDVVTLTVFRDGQERTLEVTLAPWPGGA